MKLKDSCSLEEKQEQPRAFKKQSRYFSDKGPSSQGYGFPSSHVWMWESYCKEGWVPNNWCFWTMVLKKTFESPLNSKIKLVNPRGKQPWIFIARTNGEAEAPILWPLDAKSWLIRKDPDAGKDWRQKGDDRGWDGWVSFLTEWTWVWAGSSEGQGGLVRCTKWGHKEPDMTEQLNNKILANELWIWKEKNSPILISQNSDISKYFIWKCAFQL